MHAESTASPAAGLSRRSMLAGAAAVAGTAATLSASAASGARAAEARPAGAAAAPAAADRITEQPDRAGGHARATVFRNVRPYGAQHPVDLTVVGGVVTAAPPRAARTSSTARAGSRCRPWSTRTSTPTRPPGASPG